MKLEPRQVAGFLRDPGACRLALIFGEDDGLIRERAQMLTRQVAGTLDDVFLVTELTRDGWGRLPAEMTALSLIGGRRVVQVRDATDAILPHVTAALKTPGTAMLIVEAGALPKGKLRSFAETSPDAVALACHVEDGRAVASFIRGALAEFQVRADDDAVAWLAQTLEPGRAAVRGEVEKLALFIGPNGRLTIEEAELCSGGRGAGAGEDGILAAALGKREHADSAIEAALADGQSGVGVLRMALSLLMRLHQAKLRLAAGTSPADAVRAMRPPVFFRAAPAMTRALESWSAAALLRCIEQARLVEIDCKQTGSRPELLAKRFVGDVARLAQAQQGSRPTRDAD